MTPKRTKKTAKRTGISGEYYTAKEAMSILNLPNTTFYREVDAGNIPYEIEEGRKRGKRFPKEAIDAHALRQKQAQKEILNLKFVRSTNVDIWAAIQNARNIYGEEDIIPYRKVLEWRDINDEMSMSVKSGEKLVGCTTFMPLEEDIILSLLHDEIREREIPSKAIKNWTDPQLSVYIASVAVVSSGDSNLDKERGSFLLRRTIKWAITLTHQYDIRRWYAIGATPEGQTILEALGFQEIVSLEEGKRKGYLLEGTHKPTKLLNMFFKDMGLQGKITSPKGGFQTTNNAE